LLSAYYKKWDILIDNDYKTPRAKNAKQGMKIDADNLGILVHS
jgi:hypothetical protein